MSHPRLNGMKKRLILLEINIYWYFQGTTLYAKPRKYQTIMLPFLGYH